jgi:hypothetical protein
MFSVFDGYELGMAGQEVRQEWVPVPLAPKVQSVLAIMETPACRDGSAFCDVDHTSACSSPA